MRNTLMVAGLVLIACAPLAAWGSTWCVDGSVSASGDGTSTESAFKTIQEGIDAAADGDTVVVAEGTYLENIHFKGKNIVLRSTDPFDPHVVEKTIIFGGQRGSVVAFAGTEDETCVLLGFTILSGNAEQGGGICGGTFHNRTHATIEDNVITENEAEYGGGVAHCDGAIRNNTIIVNTATHSGGGLADCGGWILNNTISENTVTSQSGDGGGLCDCDGLISNNAIVRNSAAHLGGGIYDCDGVIQNNLITGNSATWLWGGGLAFCSGIIESNTIVGNSAPYRGGGLIWCDGAIRNCIIWGNRAPTGPQINESLAPADCCIEDWTEGADGNINDDPLFVDPDGPDDNPDSYQDNDYHLQTTSPCIERGNNEDWMWDADDLDANPRIANGTVDMGAYEHSTPTDATPPYVWERHPAPDAIRVPIGTNIVLHVKDRLSGVDEMSIVMTVNDLGVLPMITGTPGDYRVSYDPPSDFSYSETVTVTVDAADLSSPPNVMERATYSFTTMREPSPARTWYVDGSVPMSGDGTSWETAFEEIQEGIDAAADGDTIVVAQGTYVENIKFESRNVTMTSRDPSDLTVVENTILDGDQSGPVVTFSGTEDETCLISGFTIQNGEADAGGGICGGSYFHHARAAIKSNIIWDNTASSGGGMAYCDGYIADNIIIGNSATGTALGGGGLAFCHATIENNTISGNSAEPSSGGGLYECVSTIQNNVIEGNTAPAGAGGAIMLFKGLLQNNTISGNSTTYGGGMYRAVGTIRNNIIVANTATNHGGAICFSYGSLVNNTISGNIASPSLWGGGLDNCHGVIRNCIIWGNSPDEIYDSGSLSFSLVGGDPKFADPDGPDNDPDSYEDNDYGLAPDSPCIDSGKNEDWMRDAVDINGNPRIMDGDGDELAVVDMGAYEARIRETTPPEITLLGDPEVTLECGTPYVEPGYTATDNYDGDITANVVVAGLVDHTWPGTYAVNYSVTDSSGNPAEPKTRVVYVVDTTPPLITLLGDNPMTLKVGTPYEEPGCTATDACDGDITADVEITGSVDPNVVGSYELRYNVSDWQGNAAEEKIRTVNVEESAPFIIKKILVTDPGPGIEITWNSRAGESYTVWSCFDLGLGPWTEEATILADAESATWTDLNTACLCKFYQIEIK